MKRCAYCGQVASLTAEHIWPSCLVRKFDDSPITYTQRKNSFYVGDPVIKDVCANCNNVKLSPLDSYMCALYEEHFSRILAPGENASIRFQYDKLLRGLLKISYNSARAHSGDTTAAKALEGFSAYLLGGEHKPAISLRLQVVTWSHGVTRAGEPTGALRPHSLRVATMSYDGHLSHRFVVRLVGINSYWFFLIIARKREPPHKWHAFLDGFSRWSTPTGVPIPDHSTQLDVPRERTTYMHPALLGNLLKPMVNYLRQ